MARSRRTRSSPCASTSTSTPTSPPTTSPTSRRRSTCTAGSPGAREVADLAELRDELEDRFGAAARAAAQPHIPPAGADQARPGRRAHRHVPRRAPRRHADRARLRARQAPAPARRGLALRVRAARSSRCACPMTRPQRFPAVVRAADVLLAVMREAQEEPASRLALLEHRSATIGRRFVTRLLKFLLALGAFFVLAALHFGVRRQRARQLGRAGRTTRRSRPRRSITGCGSPRSPRSRRARPPRCRSPIRPTSPSAWRPSRRPRPSPPRASRSRSTAQFKAQCKQEYEGLRDQVHASSSSRRVDPGRGQGPGRQGLRRGAQEVLRAAEEAVFPTEKEYAAFLKSSGMTQEDIDLRVKVDLLSNKIRTR